MFSLLLGDQQVGGNAVFRLIFRRKTENHLPLAGTDGS
jgi:hypothetical protein